MNVHGGPSNRAASRRRAMDMRQSPALPCCIHSIKGTENVAATLTIETEFHLSNPSSKWPDICQTDISHSNARHVIIQHSVEGSHPGLGMPEFIYVFCDFNEN